MALTVYTLEHRGEKFRMHGICRVPTNSMFTCNHCGAQFALDAVAALINSYINKGNSCRDITCCQKVTCPTKVVYLVSDPAGQHAPTTKDESMAEYLPGEPGFEHEVEREPAVCRWCKGTRQITVNFKTKPCEECKPEDPPEPVDFPDGVCTAENIGRGWKIRKTWHVSA
jgi:hypothetical protein